VSGNYIGHYCVYFYLCFIIYMTLSVPFNSTNILAKEHFGSRSVTGIRVLYNFVDEVLVSKRDLLLYMFHGVRLSASRPTTNLEDQGIPFGLGHHL